MVNTTVAVLGGGWAGVSASHELARLGIPFLLVEGASNLGGRSRKRDFGGYVVEECSNWIQGVGKINEGQGNPNPIWKLADRYGLRKVKKKKHPFKRVGEGSIQQNYESYVVYDPEGKSVADKNIRWDDLEKGRDCLDDKGLELNLAFWEDGISVTPLSQREVLEDCGWEPNGPIDDLIENWEYDWEWGTNPNASSAYGNPLYVYTDFGEDDEFVIDQRGYQYLVERLASEFLKEDPPDSAKWNDARLWLDTNVINIKWIHDDCPAEFDTSGCVCITTDRDTIFAEFAIVTFSVLVLKYAEENKEDLFTPALPEPNKGAAGALDYGLYTKMFMQFEKKFWDDMEFVLTATDQRAFSPVWQNLDTKKQLPGSRIIFQTLTEDLAVRAEGMDDANIIDEQLEVLQNVYPDANVTELFTNFTIIRLLNNSLFRGAWGAWNPNTPPDNPDRLRAPLNNSQNDTQKVWISGTATCRRYGGFTTGGYCAGKRDALEIAKIVGRDVELDTSCENRDPPGGNGNGYGRGQGKGKGLKG